MDALSKQAVATRNAANAPRRSAYEVATLLLKNTTETPRVGYFKEGPMLNARCRRLAGKSTVIGNTIFNFDKDGVCSVIDQGNARVDFELLLRQNGVESFPAAAPPVTMPKVAAPAPALPKEMPVVAAPVEVEVEADAPSAAPKIEEKVEPKKKFSKR